MKHIGSNVPVRPELDALMEKARDHVMTPQERIEQSISFAYGNGAIENPNITREMVEKAAYDDYRYQAGYERGRADERAAVAVEVSRMRSLLRRAKADINTIFAYEGVPKRRDMSHRWNALVCDIDDLLNENGTNLAPTSNGAVT